MKRFGYALLLLAACATPGPGTQTVPPTPRNDAAQQKTTALLAGGPVAPEQWRSLGPDALTALRQVAADPAEIPERRAKAVSGMGYLDDPAVDEVLASYATDGNALALVRTQAAESLAVHAGPKAVAVLTPLLADGNADLRHAVARALGNAGGPDAKAALQGRLDAETNAGVRDEIQKSLAKLTN